MNATSHIAGVVLTLCGLCTASSAANLHTVAISGDLALGSGTAAYFNRFGDPVLNNQGYVSFSSELSGAAVNSSNNNSIWSKIAGGQLSLEAREGDQAPGTSSGVLFSRFYGSTLNDSGDHVAFLGELDGSGVSGGTNNGIWSESGDGILRLVAREGNSAPDATDGASFTGLSAPVQNNGLVAFNGSLSGNANNSGIWSGRDSYNLNLIAREGGVAQGTEVFFKDLFQSRLALNGKGQTAFKAQLLGPTANLSNNSGVWSGGNVDELSLVARAGSVAPGTEPGVIYRSFSDPVINDNGQTAFFAFLGGPSVGSSNERSIWKSQSNGVKQLVAREGVLAPSTEVGVVFEDFNNPVLNGAGNIAFRASLKGSGISSTNHIGIWSEESGGGLKLVAREGSPAPGTESGVNFTMLHNSSLSFNESGQVAFHAPISGPGVNSGNDRGIWAEDITGDLLLVVREGDTIDVDDGPAFDLRTISQLSFTSGTGNEDGRASGFNDLGQLVYKAFFQGGGQGMFVSDIVSTTLETYSADFDLDSDVDAADLLQWKGDFGLNEESDADNDGDSDGADFLAWQRQYGSSATAIASVQPIPEPSTMMFAITVLFAAFDIRRRMPFGMKID